jgi:hypothetical protein
MKASYRVYSTFRVIVPRIQYYKFIVYAEVSGRGADDGTGSGIVSSGEISH